MTYRPLGVLACGSYKGGGSSAAPDGAAKSWASRRRACRPEEACTLPRDHSFEPRRPRETSSSEVDKVDMVRGGQDASRRRRWQARPAQPPSSSCPPHVASPVLADYPMHRALHIREVIGAVVDYLDQKSLASLSRTCRAFSEPALDVLWSRPSLTDLARYMPESSWEIVKAPSEKEPKRRSIVLVRVCISHRGFHRLRRGQRGSRTAGSNACIRLRATICSSCSTAAIDGAG
jgi:hypothetical protein